MRLVITEKQLAELIRANSQSLQLSEEGEEGAPETGTSSDGEKKTNASKWESGVTRGPGNQIGVTKWSEVVGSKITRGKANPLSEQLANGKFIDKSFYKPNPNAGSDYFASVRAQQMRDVKLRGMTQLKKHIYKKDDGDSLLLNLVKGEYQDALLDLREFIMTPGGMATQTTIEVIFSESVVVPVVIEALNAAIIINDIDLLEKQGDEDPDALFRVIEDVLMYITRGAFKLGGKALKAWLKTPAGKAFMAKISEKIGGYITSITRSLEKLPNSGLKKYIIQKVSKLNWLAKIFKSGGSAVTNIAKSYIPQQYRKAVITGLLVFMSAEALDVLIGSKKGTTKAELAKSEGPSDEYMAKVESITKSKISKEQIKTAQDLDILTAKGDRKAMASKIADLYSDVYPCLKDYANKNLFVVIAATEARDLLRINNIEYYDERKGGIYQVKTNQELSCQS